MSEIPKTAPQKLKRTARKSMRAGFDPRVIEGLASVELLQDSNVNVVAKEVIIQQQQPKKKGPTTPLSSPIRTEKLNRRTEMTPKGKLHPAVASLKRTPAKCAPAQKYPDAIVDGPLVPAGGGGFLQCLGKGPLGSKGKSSPMYTAGSKTRLPETVAKTSESSGKAQGGATKKGYSAPKKKPPTPKPARKRPRTSISDGQLPSDSETKKTKSGTEAKKSDPVQKSDSKSSSHKNYIEDRELDTSSNTKCYDSSMSDIFSKTPMKSETVKVVTPKTVRQNPIEVKTPGRVKITQASSPASPSLDKNVKVNSVEPKLKEAETQDHKLEASKSKHSVISLSSQVSFIRTSTPAFATDEAREGLGQFGASLSIIRSATPMSPPLTSAAQMNVESQEKKRSCSERIEVVDQKAIQGQAEEQKKQIPLPHRYNKQDQKERYRQKDVDALKKAKSEKHMRSLSESDLNAESHFKYATAHRKSLKIQQSSDHVLKESKGMKGTPSKFPNKLTTIRAKTLSEIESGATDEDDFLPSSQAAQAPCLKKQKSAQHKKRLSAHGSDDADSENIGQKIKRRAGDIIQTVAGGIKTPLKAAKRRSMDSMSLSDRAASPVKAKGNDKRVEIVDCQAQMPHYAKSRTQGEREATPFQHGESFRKKETPSAAAFTTGDGSQDLTVLSIELEGLKSPLAKSKQLSPPSSPVIPILPTVSRRISGDALSILSQEYNNTSTSDGTRSTIERTAINGQSETITGQKQIPVAEDGQGNDFPGGCSDSDDDVCISYHHSKLEPELQFDQTVGKEEPMPTLTREEYVGQMITETGPSLLGMITKTGSSIPVEEHARRMSTGKGPSLLGEEHARRMIQATVLTVAPEHGEEVVKDSEESGAESEGRRLVLKLKKGDNGGYTSSVSTPVGLSYLEGLSLATQNKTPGRDLEDDNQTKDESYQPPPQSQLTGHNPAYSPAHSPPQLQKQAQNPKPCSPPNKQDGKSSSLPKLKIEKEKNSVQRERKESCGIEQRNLFDALSPKFKSAKTDETCMSSVLPPHGCIQQEVIVQVRLHGIKIDTLPVLASTSMLSIMNMGISFQIQDCPTVTLPAIGLQEVSALFQGSSSTLFFKVIPPFTPPVDVMISKAYNGKSRQNAGRVSMNLHLGCLSSHALMTLVQLFHHMGRPLQILISVPAKTHTGMTAENMLQKQQTPSSKDIADESLVVDSSALPSVAKVMAMFEPATINNNNTGQKPAAMKTMAKIRTQPPLLTAVETGLNVSKELATQERDGRDVMDVASQDTEDARVVVKPLEEIQDALSNPMDQIMAKSSLSRFGESTVDDDSGVLFLSTNTSEERMSSSTPQHMQTGGVQSLQIGAQRIDSEVVEQKHNVHLQRPVEAEEMDTDEHNANVMDVSNPQLVREIPLPMGPAPKASVESEQVVVKEENVTISECPIVVVKPDSCPDDSMDIQVHGKLRQENGGKVNIYTPILKKSPASVKRKSLGEVVGKLMAGAKQTLGPLVQESVARIQPSQNIQRRHSLDTESLTNKAERVDDVPWASSAVKGIREACPEASGNSDEGYKAGTVNARRYSVDSAPTYSSSMHIQLGGSTPQLVADMIYNFSDEPPELIQPYAVFKAPKHPKIDPVRKGKNTESKNNGEIGDIEKGATSAVENVKKLVAILPKPSSRLITDTTSTVLSESQQNSKIPAVASDRVTEINNNTPGTSQSFLSACPKVSIVRNIRHMRFGIVTMYTVPNSPDRIENAQDGKKKRGRPSKRTEALSMKVLRINSNAAGSLKYVDLPVEKMLLPLKFRNCDEMTVRPTDVPADYLTVFLPGVGYAIAKDRTFERTNKVDLEDTIQIQLAPSFYNTEGTQRLDIGRRRNEDVLVNGESRQIIVSENQENKNPDTVEAMEETHDNGACRLESQSKDVDQSQSRIGQHKKIQKQRRKDEEKRLQKREMMADKISDYLNSYVASSRKLEKARKLLKLNLTECERKSTEKEIKALEQAMQTSLERYEGLSGQLVRDAQVDAHSCVGVQSSRRLGSAESENGSSEMETETTCDPEVVSGQSETEMVRQRNSCRKGHEEARDGTQRIEVEEQEEMEEVVEAEPIEVTHRSSDARSSRTPADAMKAVTGLFLEAQRLQGEAMAILQQKVIKTHELMANMRKELQQERAKREKVLTLLRQIQGKETADKQ